MEWNAQELVMATDIENESVRAKAVINTVNLDGGYRAVVGGGFTSV